MESKYQVVERCVLRWGEYDLPDPRENQMEFCRALIEEGHLPKNQNLRSAATMVRKALQDDNTTADEDSGPFDQEAKRHSYDRDHDMYRFWPPSKAAFKAPGAIVREMKRGYSNPPNGLGWTINQVCTHFKINRSKFEFMRAELGWTHDQDEFTREEHVDPEYTVEEMLEDREQRSRWTLDQLARKRGREELERKAALGVDFETQVACAREALANLDIQPLPPPVVDSDDLLTVYPMADYHFEKTEKGDHEKWKGLETLIAAGRQGSRALVVVQGDFFHRDTMGGTTTRGTNLRMNGDVDPTPSLTRAYKGLLRTLTLAAQKHSEVDVLILQGNHDEFATLHLQAAFSVLIDALGGPHVRLLHRDWEPIKTYQHGQALLAFDHGDSGRGKVENMLTKKLDDLRGQGVYDTTRRTFFFTGHLHHEIVRAIGKTKCFQLPAPTETDRYHEKSCYGAFREIVAYEFDPVKLHVGTRYQEIT